DNLTRGSFDTPVKNLVTVSARQLPPWTGRLDDLLDDIRPALARDNRIIVFAGTEKAAKALREEIAAEDINCLYMPVLPAEFPPKCVCILPGSFSFGFEYPSEKVLVITYGSRQANLSLHTRKPKRNKAHAFNSLDELHRGDYIVHTIHGIGIFDGIVSMDVSGTTKDYIKIRYAKDGTLYVPVTQLDLVSKYIGPGSETKNVTLNRLGSTDWQKTRSRVKSAVKDMAAELIALYKKRIEIKGYAFSPDIDMQSDFERRFEFDETEDQLRCIDEIKHDMEQPHPMDRLLCGDVGFGKTEVALRAAFKCVADGKQCAFLVPTTLLAMQHYQTIKKRFDTFPIACDMISRFRTPKEQEKILKGLKRGSIDIIVGTHRLISNDIQFKDLGLVIVDEEQRFGVAQKEKLKELYPNVDVLTLSATPIPRTLNMAMTGIRDMSTLEEAPIDRHPVQTYVIEFDMEIITQAIEREIRRGGQVYFLHNRVEDIERVAGKLHTAMPDVRFAVAHGKMTEDELSSVWQALLEGEIDVLVCTTIIETGVDVPNVNTLIIDNADHMGLAQLHQIRGRVGRSARRASAYFTFTRGKELTEIATHRLEAIREFTEFGSGFRIAMRDLELRGAGSILGAEQHGHMEAVGYEMYVEMLSEAVSEEKGEEPPQSEKKCLIDLRIDAHIPESYISNVPQKLAMYRRIADIRNEEDAQDVMDELIDRFGEPPACVQGLISVSLLRNSAADLGVYEIGQKGNSLILYFKKIDMNKVAALAGAMGSRISINAAAQPYIALKTAITDSPVSLLRQAIDVMVKA
ncbi:MAG TPA: transcription-repair coupling factor, partial [Ruminococcaceae bacterium]|nr:transcription-repair coupling factor [Oscillospiraceae bacterium]